MSEPDTDPAAFEAALAKASAQERKLIDTLHVHQITAPWAPEPTNQPQFDAYHSEADLLLYGGAAGGGNDLLLGLGLTAHRHSVIFRRTYVDLNDMERRLIAIRGTRAGYNSVDMALQFDGRVIEFGALERPGSELTWQGRPHDFIGFDEGAQLPESKVRFVMGWLRSEDPDQRCRVVIASNPPIGAQGEWLIPWFAPWLDPAFPDPAKPGELRWRCMRADGSIAWMDGPGMHTIDGTPLLAISCTFIPARLSDNRYLHDTKYLAQLMNLAEPLRSKLLHGDFSAGREDAANQVIRSAWVSEAQGRWKPDGGQGLKMLTLGVDVAKGGADETVLAALYGTWIAPLITARHGYGQRPGGGGAGGGACARRRADQHRPDRRLGRLRARPPGFAGHAGGAGDLLPGLV